MRQPHSQENQTHTKYLAFESYETYISSFAKVVLRGLETAEVELTKMRTGLTIFSSLVGQPSLCEKPGSAWAAVEQTRDQLHCKQIVSKTQDTVS